MSGLMENHNQVVIGNDNLSPQGKVRPVLFPRCHTKRPTVPQILLESRFSLGLFKIFDASRSRSCWNLTESCGDLL